MDYIKSTMIEPIIVLKKFQKYFYLYKRHLLTYELLDVIVKKKIG